MTDIKVKEAVLVCEAIVIVDGEERAVAFSPDIPEEVVTELVKAQVTALVAAGVAVEGDEVTYEDDSLDKVEKKEYPY